MGWANRITVARAFLTLGLWALLAVASPDPRPATWWRVRLPKSDSLPATTR